MQIKRDFSKLRSSVNRLVSSINAVTPAMREEVGQKLLGLAGLYFDTLSRGGTGIGGRQWPSASPRTVATRRYLMRQGRLKGRVEDQGVVSREMRDSLSLEIHGNEIRVFYADPKAERFDRVRRMIPTVLPRRWRRECNRIIYRRLRTVQS